MHTHTHTHTRTHTHTHTQNVGHRVRSRATSLPGLLIEKQYRVLGMRARLFARLRDFYAQ